MNLFFVRETTTNFTKLLLVLIDYSTDYTYDLNYIQVFCFVLRERHSELCTIKCIGNAPLVSMMLNITGSNSRFVFYECYQISKKHSKFSHFHLILPHKMWECQSISSNKPVFSLINACPLLKMPILTFCSPNSYRTPKIMKTL